MSDLGKLLILLGIVFVVAGLALVVLGRTEPATGKTAGRYPLSREEHDFLFSIGDVVAAERRAVGCFVFTR